MSLKYLTFLSAGESHGQQLTILLQNLPAGLPLSADDVNLHLARRQRGYGRGGRMQIERDCVRFVGGVRHGYTLGSPVAMVIENRDWPNWGQKMAVEPPTEPVEKVTGLRPGHADLAGAIKYRHDDVRNIIERASARETAARVAAGAVARQFLAHFGVEIRSHTVRIGQTGTASPELLRLNPSGSQVPEIEAFWDAVEASEVRCGDANAAARMIEDIRRTRTSGNTLGGVFEVIAYRVPMGLGSHTQWDEKLDGRLLQAVGSIHSVKAAEIGDGTAAASRYGSEVHDPIEYEPEIGWHRPTNRAGGLEGGITTGQPVVVRGFCKPISTLIQPLPSTDLASKAPRPAHVERSDVCVVPAAGVVGEAMVALAIADAFRQKFGGDSVAEIAHNYRAYLDTFTPSPSGRGTG